MLHTSDTKVKLSNLIERLETINSVVRRVATSDKPSYLSINLLNGDMNLYPRVESVLEDCTDLTKHVEYLESTLTFEDKVYILFLILNSKFRQEAVDIIISRATFARRSASKLFIHYDVDKGLVNILEESEYLKLYKGLSKEQKGTVIAFELSSSARQNYLTVLEETELLVNKIEYELDKSSY